MLMKTYLLPYYYKWISLVILTSTPLFLYVHSATAAVLTITIGLLGWLFSAERIEDERTAQQRLVAIRASAFSAVLFGAISALVVVGGYSASPAVFCVLPICLIVYLATFYGGLFLLTGQESEE